jgi:Domain of unknown function (DUF4136)
MKSLRALVLLSVFFCSLPLYAQTVKVNWQTGAPFSSYKTYSWVDPKTPGLPFYGAWVKADVIAQLNAKGLQPAAAGQTPDLYVTYHIQGQEMVDATSNTDAFDMGPGPWGGGWGWYGGWGGWGAFPAEATTTTTEQPRQMVILTIDLADAKQKKLVWRGQATVENASSSEKGDQKQTLQCVQKVFKSYPPKGK